MTNHGYTPGLRVSARTRHRVRRVLPIAGDVLVTVGDRVEAAQVVARALLPGDVTPINMAKLLSASPADVPNCMLKREGEGVAVGDVLARSRGIFGRFRTDYLAEVAGRIESISSVTGQVIVRGAPLPVQVLAYLAGDVIETLPREGCVIEADVAFVQGIFGIGGEAFGPIHMACRTPDQELSADLVTDDMKGCVIVGGGRVTAQTIERARSIGAAGIVTGGIDDQDLERVLGYALGVAITGSERIGLTLILTEGFGEISMAGRTFDLLASRAGAGAAINGATQIRAGVIRPEVVIPLESRTGDGPTTEGQDSGLYSGALVRIVRDPFFGQIGTVASLPQQPQTLPSGSMARVVEVTLGVDTSVMIPRANVERIEG